jgi:hypothetical protein
VFDETTALGLQHAQLAGAKKRQGARKQRLALERGTQRALVVADGERPHVALYPLQQHLARRDARGAAAGGKQRLGRVDAPAFA